MERPPRLMAREKPHMILLPLMQPDTAWANLEPLIMPRDFSNTSPYHVHETSPVPLGYEAGEIIDIDKLDDAQASDFVTLPAELTSKRTEPLAWLIAVPLTCTALYVVWSILAILWRIVSKVIL